MVMLYTWSLLCRSSLACLSSLFWFVTQHVSPPPNYQGQQILLTLMFFLINLILLCLTETVNKLDCVLCDAHLLLGQ